MIFKYLETRKRRQATSTVKATVPEANTDKRGGRLITARNMKSVDGNFFHLSVLYRVSRKIESFAVSSVDHHPHLLSRWESLEETLAEVYEQDHQK